MDMDALVPAARAVLDAAKAKGLKIATAESCTGGLVAAALTAVPGSSAVFDSGFVTYSNEAKTEMLGVPASAIAAHGAVSEETALAMAEGALAYSNADIAVAITGIAGPDGGTTAKPVGTVWFGFATRDGAQSAVHLNFGDIGRDAVRMRAAAFALKLLGAP
ncbi:MAG: nicotinamide-nucleotide amidohydrolase family protein [Pseudomonadota bacterium]